MGAKTPGRRVEHGKPHEFEPGDYGTCEDHWYCMTPNGHLGRLAGHQVTSHDDGTITVSPSILISTTGNVQLWHGFLKRGVWEEC